MKYKAVAYSGTDEKESMSEFLLFKNSINSQQPFFITKQEKVIDLADQRIKLLEKRAEEIIANDEHEDDDLILQIAVLLSASCDILSEILERRV